MDKSSKERRNQELSERFSKGETAESLARAYGLSERTIWLILSKMGTTGGDRPRRKRPRRQDRRPLSSLHARIGVAVSSARRLDLGLGVSAFAERVKLSPDRVAGIEAGYHDVSVTELIKIAEGIGRPIEEIVRPRTAFGSLSR